VASSVGQVISAAGEQLAATESDVEIIRWAIAHLDDHCWTSDGCSKAPSAHRRLSAFSLEFAGGENHDWLAVEVDEVQCQRNEYLTPRSGCVACAVGKFSDGFGCEACPAGKQAPDSDNLVMQYLQEGKLNEALLSLRQPELETVMTDMRLNPSQREDFETAIRAGAATSWLSAHEEQIDVLGALQSVSDSTTTPDGAANMTCASCPAGQYSNTFTPSCVTCDEGLYQDQSGQSSCLSCGGEGRQASDDKLRCDCAQHYFSHGHICVRCPEDGYCPGGPLGAAPLCPAIPGIYFGARDMQDRQLVVDSIACDSTEACVELSSTALCREWFNRTNGTTANCRESHHGELCGDCDSGYRKVNGRCTECSSFNWVVVLLRLLFLVLVAAFWWLLAQEPVWSLTAVEKLFVLRDTLGNTRPPQGALSKGAIDELLHDMGSRHKAHTVIHDLQLKLPAGDLDTLMEGDAKETVNALALKPAELEKKIAEVRRLLKRAKQQVDANEFAAAVYTLSCRCVSTLNTQVSHLAGAGASTQDLEDLLRQVREERERAKESAQRYDDDGVHQIDQGDFIAWWDQTGASSSIPATIFLLQTSALLVSISAESEALAGTDRPGFLEGLDRLISFMAPEDIIGACLQEKSRAYNRIIEVVVNAVLLVFFMLFISRSHAAGQTCASPDAHTSDGSAVSASATALERFHIKQRRIRATLYILLYCYTPTVRAAMDVLTCRLGKGYRDELNDQIGSYQVLASDASVECGSTEQLVAKQLAVALLVLCVCFPFWLVQRSYREKYVLDDALENARGTNHDSEMWKKLSKWLKGCEDKKSDDTWLLSIWGRALDSFGVLWAAPEQNDTWNSGFDVIYARVHSHYVHKWNSYFFFLCFSVGYLTSMGRHTRSWGLWASAMQAILSLTTVLLTMSQPFVAQSDTAVWVRVLMAVSVIQLLTNEEELWESWVGQETSDDAVVGDAGGNLSALTSITIEIRYKHSRITWITFLVLWFVAQLLWRRGRSGITREDYAHSLWKPPIASAFRLFNVPLKRIGLSGSVRDASDTRYQVPLYELIRDAEDACEAREAVADVLLHANVKKQQQDDKQEEIAFTKTELEAMSLSALKQIAKEQDIPYVRDTYDKIARILTTGNIRLASPGVMPFNSVRRVCPLHYAVHHGKLEAVRLMLDRKLFKTWVEFREMLNTKTMGGFTAFHFACLSEKKDANKILEELVEAGCDTSMRTAQEKTGWDMVHEASVASSAQGHSETKERAEALKRLSYKPFATEADQTIADILIAVLHDWAQAGGEVSPSPQGKHARLAKYIQNLQAKNQDQDPDQEIDSLTHASLKKLLESGAKKKEEDAAKVEQVLADLAGENDGTESYVVSQQEVAALLTADYHKIARILTDIHTKVLYKEFVHVVKSTEDEAAVEPTASDNDDDEEKQALAPEIKRPDADVQAGAVSELEDLALAAKTKGLYERIPTECTTKSIDRALDNAAIIKATPIKQFAEMLMRTPTLKLSAIIVADAIDKALETQNVKRRASSKTCRSVEVDQQRRKRVLEKAWKRAARKAKQYLSPAYPRLVAERKVTKPKTTRTRVEELELPFERLNFWSVQPFDNWTHIASGAFGDVCLVEDIEPPLRTGRYRKAAVKIARRENQDENKQAEMFNEIASLAKLDHENVVSILGFTVGPSPVIDQSGVRKQLFNAPGTYGKLKEAEKSQVPHPRDSIEWMVVCEYCETDLFKKIYGRDHRSDPDDWLDVVMNFAEQISSGLEYLETQERPHFDIKPMNVLLSVQHDKLGRVETIAKLSDFGMTYSEERQSPKLKKAQQVLEDLKARKGDDQAITEANTELEREKNKIISVGTWEYMAPECWKRLYGTPGVESDVFSFGLMLWEMISRARVYTACWSDDATAPTIRGKDGKPEVNVPLIAKQLADGWRPERPENCPNHMWLLMQACWTHDNVKGKDARPQAYPLSLVIKLIRARRTLERYIPAQEVVHDTSYSSSTSLASSNDLYDTWLSSLKIVDKKQDLHDYDIREGKDPLGKLVEMMQDEEEDFEEMVEDLFADDADGQATSRFRAEVQALTEPKGPWKELLEQLGVEGAGSRVDIRNAYRKVEKQLRPFAEKERQNLHAIHSSHIKMRAIDELRRTESELLWTDSNRREGA
jgi:serine/threonine protein kinase